jgi:hypothetical protein
VQAVVAGCFGLMKFWITDKGKHLSFFNVAIELFIVEPILFSLVKENV